jgi:hypothetical protein
LAIKTHGRPRSWRHPTRIRQLHGFFDNELQAEGPGFENFVTNAEG